MSDDSARESFLSEGFKSYLDAFNALTAFEAEIQELTKTTVQKRLSELKKALGNIDLTADEISDVGLQGEEGYVAIGVQVPAPEVWFIRFGLKWGEPNPKRKVRPVYAACAVRIGSQQKRRTLSRAFTSAKQKSMTAINLRTTATWPHEVQLDIPLPAECTASQFEQRLVGVISAFLALTTAAGGLKQALSS